MKVYVHHYYSKSLFYKIAHGTENRKYDLKEDVGSVFCEYKGNQIQIIFNPILNDNEDGFHLIDFLTINYQLYSNSDYTEIDCINTEKHQTAHRGWTGGEFGVNDVPIMKWIADKLEYRKNWIVLLLRTEKSFIFDDGINYALVSDLEIQIKRLKNHWIFSDNFFIDNLIESEKYPKHNFLFTNTIHQWNELLSIRWYYEFANVYTKLNPPYDLCFSMRYHKRNRVDLIRKLANLENPKIYLSRTDNCKNAEWYRVSNSIKNIENINLNKWEGYDFDDISWIENIEHYLDYIMRILPMSKIHILSESWDWWDKEFVSMYLSEKTYGLLLGKIPFIPTHSYPLTIIQCILNIEEYPFYNEIKKCNGKEDELIKFINWFFEDYDINYEKIKNWINICHNKFINKLNSENSLIDILTKGLGEKQGVSLNKKLL